MANDDLVPGAAVAIEWKGNPHDFATGRIVDRQGRYVRVLLSGETEPRPFPAERLRRLGEATAAGGDADTGDMVEALTEIQGGISRGQLGVVVEALPDTCWVRFHTRRGDTIVQVARVWLHRIGRAG